jgi:predicted GTPase
MSTDYSTYRHSEIDYRLAIGGYHPLDIMVCGATGAGKSTTLNSLFRKTVAKAGEHCEPETQTIGEYRLHPNIRLWDTPGLGDGKHQDRLHGASIRNLLRQTCTISGTPHGLIDLALVIIDASSRDLGTARTLINDFVLQHISPDRVIVAINQADFAMKGRHWDSTRCRPDKVLSSYLTEVADSVRERITADTGMRVGIPACYSARYHFNIHKLLDSIIDRIPSGRRASA